MVVNLQPFVSERDNGDPTGSCMMSTGPFTLAQLFRFFKNPADLFRCHVKMGAPYFGHPGSPYSYENGDPGPYNHMNMGTPGPHIYMNIGTLSAA